MTTMRSKIHLEFSFNALGTVRVVISKRMRWVRHAARMGQYWPAYGVLVGGNRTKEAVSKARRKSWLFVRLSRLIIVTKCQ